MCGIGTIHVMSYRKHEYKNEYKCPNFTHRNFPVVQIGKIGSKCTLIQMENEVGKSIVTYSVSEIQRHIKIRDTEYMTKGGKKMKWH